MGIAPRKIAGTCRNSVKVVVRKREGFWQRGQICRPVGERQ